MLHSVHCLEQHYHQSWTYTHTHYILSTHIMEVVRVAYQQNVRKSEMIQL